jgi:hypothetical protein
MPHSSRLALYSLNMEDERPTDTFYRTPSDTYNLSRLRSQSQSQASTPWLGQLSPEADYGWPTSPAQASTAMFRRKAVPSGGQYTPVSPAEGTDDKTQRPGHLSNNSYASYASVQSGVSQSEDALLGNLRDSGRLQLLPSPQSQPYNNSSSPLPPSQWRWLSGSWTMYCLLILGIASAISHHAYYSHLNGQPARNQNTMLRYGTALAYITKASLVAATIFGFKQQIWATVRRKNIQISTIDSLFAAIDDPSALLNLEMATKAKIAFALAIIVW